MSPTLLSQNNFRFNPISSVPTSRNLQSGIMSYPNFSNRNQQRQPNETHNRIQTPINNDENDGEGSQKKGIFSILKTHATEISTAHGYPIIFKSKRWYGKLFWILVLLVAFGAFGRQSYILFDRYLQAPVAVEVSWNKNKSLCLTHLKHVLLIKQHYVYNMWSPCTTNH